MARVAWATAVALALLDCAPFASGEAKQKIRNVVEKTPLPCKDKYPDEDISEWVKQHLAGKTEGHEKPHLLLLLGGSGSGKTSFLKSVKEHQDDFAAASPFKLTDFVNHGLDAYLDYIPEYSKTINDADNVYKDAADSCYSGAAIPAAKRAGALIVERRMHLIYEETGKDLARIKKRVLPPFVEAGYRITVALIDNDSETAIARAAGRFALSGRYASDEYIRGTFNNVFSSYEALKKMDVVSEAVYCDNSGMEMRCWGDTANANGHLIPEKFLITSEAPRYRSKSAAESEL